MLSWTLHLLVLEVLRTTVSLAAGPAVARPLEAEMVTRDADLLLVEGQAALQKGKATHEGRAPGDAEPDLRRAQKAFENILRHFPREEEAPEAGLLLGLTYVLLDDTKAALDSYRRTYEDYPAFKARHLALLWRAICEAGLGHVTEAQGTFQTYLRDYPQNTSEIATVRKHLKEMEIVGLPAPPFPEADGLYSHIERDGLRSFEGQVVVLYFFATWCAACAREMPHLRSLLNRWESSDVVFLGVANPEDPRSKEPLETFLDTGALPFFDVFLDRKLASLRPYRVTAFPAAVVIDRKGIVRWRGHPGMFPAALVEALPR